MTNYSHITNEREPDSSGPIGECGYVCDDSEHVGGGKYVCLYPSHWVEADPLDNGD